MPFSSTLIEVSRYALFSLLIALTLSGCQQSKDVVSKGWIQKRKHRPGLFVQIPSIKTTSYRTEIQPRQEAPNAEITQGGTFSVAKPSSQIAVEKIVPEKLPIALKNPTSSSDFKVVIVDQHRAAKKSFNDFKIKAQPPNAEDEGLVKTLTSISKITALLSAFSAVMFTGLLIYYIVMLGNLLPIVLALLIGLAIASVLLILISLAISYLLYEKYNSEEAMIWTNYAAYVLGAALSVFGYLFYIAALI